MIDTSLSIREGGIYVPGAGQKKGWSWTFFETMAKANKIDLDIPVKKLNKEKLYYFIWNKR